MPGFGLQPMRDETPQTDYNKRLKHMRRVDMWRLLKHLGVPVDVSDDGEKLRQKILANGIDVFKYVDPDYLKFNPDSEALQKAMAQRRGVVAPKPTGEPLPSLPVISGDPVPEPQGVASAIPGKITAMNDEMELSDLSVEGLKKLCTKRGIKFKPNESRTSLTLKLNGQDAA